MISFGQSIATNSRAAPREALAGVDHPRLRQNASAEAKATLRRGSDRLGGIPPMHTGWYVLDSVPVRVSGPSQAELGAPVLGVPGTSRRAWSESRPSPISDWRLRLCVR